MDWLGGEDTWGRIMNYEIMEIGEADIGMNQKCGKIYLGPALKQDDHDGNLRIRI